MKNILSAVFVYSAFCSAVVAQPVIKNVIAEHFTNTYCPPCASRNGGFYANLHQYPQVLHISYHPSLPYPACPLNQSNKIENDDRTNYYGIFGATPRIVIQGKVISGSADYEDTALLQSELNKNTAFDIEMSMQQVSPNSIDVKAVIIKKAASSIVNLELYGAIVEDTLFFTANNGETLHPNVFRRSIWSSPSMSIVAPANVGDSIVYKQTILTDTAWDLNRVYSIGILQESNMDIVQVQRSNYLSNTLRVGELNRNHIFSIYPNPSTDYITILSENDRPSTVTISDMSGRVIKRDYFHTKNKVIDISQLSNGLYLITVAADGMRYSEEIMKY